MEDLSPIWIAFAALGLFGVMVFLRLLVSYLERTLKTYDTAREALRLRREYVADMQSRQVADDGDVFIEL
jgi:hypothetical protein